VAAAALVAAPLRARAGGIRALATWPLLSEAPAAGPQPRCQPREQPDPPH